MTIKYYGYKFDKNGKAEYISKADDWAKDPADLEYFKRFFKERIDEIEANLLENPTFSCIDAFMLLRMHTDWIIHND